MTERLTEAEARLIRAADIYERIHGPLDKENDDAAADFHGALCDVRTERMSART
jgi:hypothetical protein